MPCPWGCWPIKGKESRDQKYLEAKKTSNIPGTNQNGGSNGSQSGQSDQPRQSTGCSIKKDSCLHHRTPKGQGSNTLAIGVNTTAVKKANKVKVDLSQIEYQNYHKKDHYSNKCLDKKLKNQYQSGQLARQ